MAFVEVRDLSKTYRSGEVLVEALKGVSFDIHEGEILAILGPSGCGKSTLLNCLSGIDTPTEGKVTVKGVDLHSLKDDEKTRFRAMNMGFVFQFYNLIPVLKAVENVELAMLTMGSNEKKAREAAMEILAKVNLREREHYLPSRLSGGERQRVSIARALVHKPAIVWADEPTGALDTKTSNDLMNLITELNETFNQTFVIVTHDERVSAFSNRVLHMDSGSILKIEENKELKV
ncbi:MAG: ABC transporter ATP-binding protein [Mesotoga sp.]|uniref:ABC transporter ATP-binding protein n=1 Tax=Mesotoga TaxID=1184396 RepID=UPI001BD31B63|nr:ATP-binding cassette domain-containing protein [Mesotoga prima]HNQ71539.1 ABC transporter ATP-binding protein [Mesotoga prima]HNS76582.1 ABC transporter ATP-binding protein [Mesotoga prima]